MAKTFDVHQRGEAFAYSKVRALSQYSGSFGMDNLITITNLEKGMTYLREQKPTWEKDFHNTFYRERLFSMRNGLNPEWWETTLLELGKWKALRGKRGLTKEKIRRRGLDRLEDLQDAYNQVIHSTNNNPLNLSTVSWKQMRNLYSIARAIKNVDSPVFASKLCHFIIPDAYPVIDAEVLGLPTQDYEQYWRFCQAQWSQCDDKMAIQDRLKAKTGSSVISEYPFSTKITELCFIGVGKTHLASTFRNWRE